MIEYTANIVTQRAKSIAEYHNIELQEAIQAVGIAAALGILRDIEKDLQKIASPCTCSEDPKQEPGQE